MLKYVNYEVVFAEIPDEISLAINISNCPCKCPGCHSPYLAEDIGTLLTPRKLKGIIEENRGITCVCFMGGDLEPHYINTLAILIKESTDLKVGWYSGRQMLSEDIDLKWFDFIKELYEVRLASWVEHYEKEDENGDNCLWKITIKL